MAKPPDPRKVPKQHGTKPPNPQKAKAQHGKKPPAPKPQKGKSLWDLFMGR